MTDNTLRDPEDMQNVGNALMDAIEKDFASHPFMKHWHPTDCPTEIVGDLLNALDEVNDPFQVAIAPDTPPDNTDLIQRLQRIHRVQTCGRTTESVYSKAAAALATKDAEIAALTQALKTADEAISEMFRYYDGGETRGSYDGKPERSRLRKAGYVTRAALGPKP